MRNTFFAVVLGLLLLALNACSGNSPTGPSSPPAGSTFGAQVSAVCAQFPHGITSVVVTLDGVVIGTAVPGGPSLTRTVTIGSHSISGLANNGVRWNDTRTLTASQPDFIVTFACAS